MSMLSVLQFFLQPFKLMKINVLFQYLNYFLHMKLYVSSKHKFQHVMHINILGYINKIC
jgi:hypothetical protein